MALSTFGELKTALASWLHRTDLTAQIPDFITLIESQMSEDLTAKAMQATTTLSTIADSAYVDLPDDFKRAIRLTLTADPVGVLRFAAPEELSSEFRYGDAAQPVLYTVIGTQLQLAPAPDAIYSLPLTYERRIPALSDDNPTNWLLTRSPNAYLFGALMMAQPYIVNDPRFPQFQAMYATAINGINNTDWHSGAQMRVRAG